MGRYRRGRSFLALPSGGSVSTTASRWPFIRSLTALHRSLRERQIHLKTGVAGLGDYLNISLVLFHNSLNCVEAETGPFTHSLGGEERFKNVVFDLRRNSRAVIADLNHNARILAIGSNP